jgi:hypothetical protein
MVAPAIANQEAFMAENDVTSMLAGLEPGESMNSGGLQVFGIHTRPGGRLEYLTLGEALGEHGAEITEVGEAGSVPTVLIRNRLDRRVLLLAGEELVGCKQNRSVNVSMMVEAKSESHLPVSCVEAGRWRHASSRFSSRPTLSHATLRKLQCRTSAPPMREGPSGRSDQHAVWSEVSRKLSAMKCESSTSDLSEIFNEYSGTIRGHQEDLPVPAGCNGAAFAIHGRMSGAELFDRPDTLQKFWKKLTGSYLLDALEPPGPPRPPLSAAEAMAWVGSAQTAAQERFRSPCLGEDVRLRGPSLSGAALVVDGVPVHLCLFHEEAGPGA